VSPWFETVAVCALIAVGTALGKAFSDRPKPYWLLGYTLALALVGWLLLVTYNQSLHFAQLFIRIATGRARFVILSFAVTIGLISPLSRLPRKSERLIVCTVTALIVTWFSVLPFLSSAMMENRMRDLRTRFDSDGICIQNTAYTCAPAAAVTALARLGLPASEGEIANLSRTNPITGTLPWSLCAALGSRYVKQGLRCRYRCFESVAQLADAGVTLVILKDKFLSDHCVTVLAVSGDTVTVADPEIGKRSISSEQFKKVWRFCGIVLDRKVAEAS